MRTDNRKLLITGGFCILAITVALLFRFVFVSEERRIEMTLKDAIEAVRDEDVEECMKHIALAEWDTTQAARRDLETVVREGFDTFDNIRVLYEEFSADVTDGHATVRVKVRVIANYEEQVMLLLGTLTEGRELELGMVKRGERWLVSSISGVEIPVDALEEF